MKPFFEDKDYIIPFNKVTTIDKSGIYFRVYTDGHVFILEDKEQLKSYKEWLVKHEGEDNGS